MGVVLGGWAKIVKGLKSTNWLLQNSFGDVKYSLGNRVAKEYICMTHGHGWCGDCLREWGVLGGEGKGGIIRTTGIAYTIKYNLN